MFGWLTRQLVSFSWIRNQMIKALESRAKKTDNDIDDAAVVALDRFLQSEELTVRNLLQAIAITASDYSAKTETMIDDYSAEVLFKFANSKKELSYAELLYHVSVKLQEIVDNSENVYDDAVYKALETLRNHFFKVEDA